MPPELYAVAALVAWVAILDLLAAWVDRRRELRRLRAIERRGGRIVDEDDAIVVIANARWEPIDEGRVDA